jgi:hypothetical protein
MRTQKVTLVAIAGGVVAAVAALLLLTGGKAEARSSREQALSRGKTSTTAARPRAAYAWSGADSGNRGVEQAAATSSASDIANPVAATARDLLARIGAAVGSTPELPAELRRDLLDFLAGGAANQAALFSVAWDPGTSRMVLGHLKVFLMGIPDEDARRGYLAAFDACDPHAAERAAVAARAKDPSLFVATLRAAASPKEKVDAILRLPKEARTEPAIAAWLLEAARDDASEDVRGNAYAVLALSGNRDALPVITAAAADTGRSVAERKRAAFAMGLHPRKASLDELFRIYDQSPDEVRRNLLASFAVAPSSPRVDSLLLEVLGSSSTSEKTRKAAACALEDRLALLSAPEARDLGARVAEVIKSIESEQAVVVLNSLGGAVCRNEPIRDAVKELERTAPAGGAIQLAMVNIPSLRFALGRN